MWFCAVLRPVFVLQIYVTLLCLGLVFLNVTDVEKCFKLMNLFLADPFGLGSLQCTGKACTVLEPSPTSLPITKGTEVSIAFST